jgi:hypothetical protein
MYCVTKCEFLNVKTGGSYLNTVETSCSFHKVFRLLAISHRSLYRWRCHRCTRSNPCSNQKGGGEGVWSDTELCILSSRSSTPLYCSRNTFVFPRVVHATGLCIWGPISKHKKTVEVYRLIWIYVFHLFVGWEIGHGSLCLLRFAERALLIIRRYVTAGTDAASLKNSLSTLR